MERFRGYCSAVNLRIRWTAVFRSWNFALSNNGIVVVSVNINKSHPLSYPHCGRVRHMDGFTSGAYPRIYERRIQNCALFVINVTKVAEYSHSSFLSQWVRFCRQTGIAWSKRSRRWCVSLEIQAHSRACEQILHYDRSQVFSRSEQILQFDRRA